MPLGEVLSLEGMDASLGTWGKELPLMFKEIIYVEGFLMRYRVTELKSFSSKISVS